MIFCVWMLHWQKKIDNISSTTLRNKLRTVRKNYKTALSKLALDFKNKVLKFAGLHRIDALSATLLMYVFFGPTGVLVCTAAWLYFMWSVVNPVALIWWWIVVLI